MRYVHNRLKFIPKKALSFILAFAVFLGMFVGMFTIMLSFATNPTHTGALNTYVPVEFINLKPVEIGKTNYVDDDGHTVKDVSSRTIYGDSAFADYFDVTVRNDESVRFKMKQTKPAVSNDTAYVYSFTQVNQMVNLQQNPFFMVSWDANCRVNGSINFTITKGDKSYYINNQGNNSISDDTITEVSSGVKEITPNDSAYSHSSFTFYQIAENKHVTSTNTSYNDFPVMSRGDYTVDLYAYLYSYFSQKNWISDYWPDWSSGDYITINYVTHIMVSDKENTPLYDYSYINWNTCGIGRLALNQYNSLLPRIEALVQYGHYNDNNEIVYDETPGRSARLDDGTYVFRNTSDTQQAVFRWDVKRFVNINELQAMYLDAQLTNTDSDMEMELALLGKNFTTNSSTAFTNKGYWATLSDLVSNHSDKKVTTLDDKYSNVTIDLNEDVLQKAESDTTYYPDDHMIYIREILLVLPANAKLSVNSFAMKIENDFAPSTTSDTVYPWATSNTIDNLPPEGTPATSDILDPTSGSNSAAYNWASTSTPITENKVDLLAMTDQHVLYDDSTGKFKGFEQDDVTGYWRTLEGKSHFTSKSTDIVYREFRRRDKNVTVSTDRDNTNFYIEIPVSTTPYLYYSYTLNGGSDKALGLYFYIANTNKVTDANGNGHTYNHFYLGQSGLALSTCDSIMESTNDSVADAHRALCSSAEARTGIIDLRSIGFKDGDIAQIRDMRFYLTGTSTEAVFDYLFFGSETLDESVTDTIAKNSGDAFPWSITHDQFKEATLGTDSEFTFANRLDVIDDMLDRKIWNLKEGTYTEGDEKTAFGSAFIYNNDGSITVSAKSTQHYVEAGTSFDHTFGFTINKSDLASLRYINYSVEAQPGMRWSILFREHATDGTTDDAGIALRTWSDAMMTGDFYGPDDSTSNAKDSGATVGKSYFRELTADVFNDNWYNGQSGSSNAEDEAWAMFTVPGSETGCFDLSQIQKNMSWDSVISIWFIVYRDPSLKSEDGTKDVGGSVTFNYVYLTSEPLKGDSFGTACLTPNSNYSWGYNADPLTGSDRNITLTGNPTTSFNYEVTTTWSAVSGCTDYYLDANHTALSLTSYHKNDYSVYYSFRFTDKKTGDPAYPKCMVGFFDSDGTYVLQTRRSLFGKTELYTGDIDNLRGVYRLQMTPSGVVSISNLGFDKLRNLRVYYDVNKYQIHLQYVTVAWTDGYTEEKNSQKKSLVRYSGKVADFSDSLYTTDSGIVDVVFTEGGKTFTSDFNTAKSIRVDLNRTPYLFYSIKYDKGATGTFALATDITVGNQNGFYRNGVEAELRSQNLLSPGVSPSSDNYMPESETGCIDVRAWLQRQGAMPSNGIINITRFYAYVSGGNAHYYYMYFGAEADKTIDLLPEKAQADLENGVSTHSAVFETGKMCELQHVDANTPDDYIDKSLIGSSTPLMVTHLTGDKNSDGYNDLTYSNTIWGYYNMCYGQIQEPHEVNGHTYVGTGNNQMSGLTINLNETPYLHFSISQPSTSLTTFLLQVNNNTGREVVRDLTADKVRPWLSCYNSKSPAGQLMHISPQTSYITFYKDTTMEYTNGTYESGDFAGVIDLRRWFTETNGYDDIISLERVRFYTVDPNVAGKQSDVTVNHFYLSSSCGAAYSVTFDKNDGSDKKQTIQVLKNANDQYVSDDVPTELGYKTREGYTFVGWYLDPDWETYFDIENTPVHGNLRLYAGWLKNSDVVTGELNFVENAKEGSVITSGTGRWETDNEALHIRNTGETDYSITIPVNKAYSLYDSHSIYIGMDTANSMQANVDLDDETRATDGARIVLDLKSLGSHEYDLLGADFGSYFLTENNILTAAPYNEQLPMYTHLANKDLLPVKENTEGYVYAKSITFTIPAGYAMHIRYATAAKAIDASIGSVVAPSITGSVLDLLDPKGDEGYVEQLHNTTYELLDEKTEIYEREATPTELMQAQITGVNTGYATLGSLYGLGNSLGEIVIDKNNKQYLYYSISQNDISSTTFNIWCSIYYESSTASGYKHPPKWSSHFDARDCELHSQDDLVSGSIVRDAFASGSVSGRIDLYDWYSDALTPLIERGEIPADSKVTKVKITGVRLYTANSGTEATFNYLAIGGEDDTDETLRAKAEVINADGNAVQEIISDVDFGQIVRISLDQLKNSAFADDPSKQFIGWSFDAASQDSLVWWNPKLSTQVSINDKKASASNPNGSWTDDEAFAQANDFVTNRKDISYQLTDETKVIYPVFSDAFNPTLTVLVNGSGSVSFVRNGSNQTVTSSSKYSATFAETFVLNASEANFVGWYDTNNVLLSTDYDYMYTIFGDSVIEARFENSQAQDTVSDVVEHAIIWLQSGDPDLGVAGEAFKLISVHNGTIEMDSLHYSNIEDATGSSEIVCYWSIINGQLLQATAPTNYHWEHLLSDGSTICISDSNVYQFIAAEDMKLVCVKNDSHEDKTTILSNDYAVAFSRTNTNHLASVTGQILPPEGEEIVACGIVMAPRPTRVQYPSLHSHESTVYAAHAWNSTTGQFTVDVSYAPGMARFIRTFAIVRNQTTGAYSLHYGDVVTITF